MNDQYVLADTPGERIAIAILVAIKNQPSDVSAGEKKEFYRDFIEPFLQRELRQAQLDELHLLIHGKVKKRERELVESLHHWDRKCQEKL